MRAAAILALAALALSSALAAALLLATPVAADESMDLDAFRAANLLYEDGNFEEAARSYEHLARLGYRDATLYYNLGNAYYRTGDTGRALLNYIRAKRLAPFDADIEANLDLVRESVEAPGSSNQRPVPILAQLADRTPWVSLNAAAVAALVCWLTIWTAVLVLVWHRNLRYSAAIKRAAVAATFGLVLFGCLTVGSHLSRNHWSQTGVVIAQSADVLEAPNTRARVEINLDAGREVRIIETRGGWTRIRLPRTELEGWTPAVAVETVLPQSG